MLKLKRIVLVNSDGHVIGEDHHRAKLTNAQVDQVLDLRDGGMHYREIAEQFKVAKSTIADICKMRRRAQVAMGQKCLITQRVRVGVQRIAKRQDSEG